MKIAKNNLDVQIAMLEAKLGIIPNIQWCADAIKNPKLQKAFKDMSESAMTEELQKLRAEKVKQKLFWVQKELNRSAKKAKAFNVQKIVKKMKTLEEDKKSTMEEDLKTAKAVNHSELAVQIYKTAILNSSNEYIRTALGSFGLSPVEVSGDCESKIMQQKALQSDISTLQNDLESFLRKLLHEPVAKETVPETRQDKRPKEERVRQPKIRNNETHSDNEEDVDQDTSFFVSNLNQDSDEENSRGGSQRKKNRMGQKARRALAEARYGQTANHLKTTNRQPDSRPKHHERYNDRRDHNSDRRDQYNDRRDQYNDRRVFSQVPKNSAEELHPSWHAKQLAKQKEQNAHFQGTKKVFADDE